ncbi:MAG TPA: triose-phosphate isomerase [Candidatus Paceibacterota bacterium]|nr:triose-phosphate isomerase [Candidatus Paceibacterota bacterium]
MKKKKRMFIAGNWKMNPQSLEAAKEVFRQIKKSAAKLKNTDVVICPPTLYLSELKKIAKDDFALGVQNIHWELSGSHTGEISARMAADVGAHYSIIGHSERRAMGESDEEVSKKIAAAFAEGLVGIVCVGERERDTEGQYLEFLKNQIEHSLAGVSKSQVKRLILAYEPVWAIGRKDNAALGGKELYETVLYIRKVLLGIYGKDIAFGIPVLYGGSATFQNVGDILSEGEVEGLLVGRQSLEPEGFAQLLRIANSL